MKQSVKIFLGDRHEGIDDCEIILQLDGYSVVDVLSAFKSELSKAFKFDKDMIHAYAQRVFDSLSDEDMCNYLRVLSKSFPAKTVIHTSEEHFAILAKSVLNGTLIRVSLYGNHPRIPLENKNYDAVLEDIANIAKV